MGRTRMWPTRFGICKPVNVDHDTLPLRCCELSPLMESSTASVHIPGPVTSKISFTVYEPRNQSNIPLPERNLSGPETPRNRASAYVWLMARTMASWSGSAKGLLITVHCVNPWFRDHFHLRCTAAFAKGSSISIPTIVDIAESLQMLGAMHVMMGFAQNISASA